MEYRKKGKKERRLMKVWIKRKDLKNEVKSRLKKGRKGNTLR